MKLLDLYCGVGGAGYGYVQAGFDVTGVKKKLAEAIPPAYTHYIGEQLAQHLTMEKQWQCTGST